MIRLLGMLLMLAGTAAQSADYIEVPGRLSDDDFYNLVSCEALPGQPCRFEHVRWKATDAKDLTISIFQIAPDYTDYVAADAALDNAVAEINGLGAGLTLRRVADGEDAHVTIYLSEHKGGDKISGVGIKGVDGSNIQGAYVHIFWNGARELTRGVIIFSIDLGKQDIEPVMLEEVVQSLGLLTDIRSPWYETRSIFSEDTNLVTKLGGQDAMVLRRHYPPAQ